MKLLLLLSLIMFSTMSFACSGGNSCEEGESCEKTQEIREFIK